MKLTPTILPAKVLKDGTHRIRIGMSHRGDTRYFVTRFTVPARSNVVGGAVVGVPNANYINQQLLKKMSEIYRAFDELEDIDFLSCSQLLMKIEEKLMGERPITLAEVLERYSKKKERENRETTIRITKNAIDKALDFFGGSYIMKDLTANALYDFDERMSGCGLNDTTRSMYLIVLKKAVYYAVSNGLVVYTKPPFKDFKMPRSRERNVGLSIEEIRAIRDARFDDMGRLSRRLCFMRDLFMLSFYLCGMNMVDIMRLDFSGETIRFMRQKTETRRSADKSTEFTIQPEARVLIDRLMPNGKLMYGGKECVRISIQPCLTLYLPKIAAACGISSRIIFYSARKSFAQIANELMVKDSVIEYCIGDAVSISNKTIGAYINVNRRMADAAIRRVFDAVASDKTMDELVEPLM